MAFSFAAGAFTNITRDHLDYHPSFEDYFAPKLRLFTEVLPEGAAAVVDVDSRSGESASPRRRRSGSILLRSDARARRCVSCRLSADGFGQRLMVEHDGRRHELRLPLVGDFQASNALVAAGLVIATGASAAQVLPMLESLQGARGRLDLAGTSKAGAPIFVDYAHTPDALAKALDALSPYVENRLIVVFGCGGDRDKGKRPEMGEVAVAGSRSCHCDRR